MDYNLIGKQIRKYRKERGMSQEELAFRINISSTHMSHIETGSTKLSLPVLVRLSDTLHISLDRLVRGDETVSAAYAFMESFADFSNCSEREQHIAANLVKAYLEAVKKESDSN